MSEEFKVKDGVEKSGFDRAPFETAYLDSEKEKTGSEILTLRLNKTERARLNRLRKALNYGQDAKVIKACLLLGENVIHGTFGLALMEKLTGPDRRRPISEELLGKEGSRNLYNK